MTRSPKAFGFTASILKTFSKTRPMKVEHFAECVEWWNNRREIKDTDTETFKAKFNTA